MLGVFAQWGYVVRTDGSPLDAMSRGCSSITVVLEKFGAESPIRAAIAADHLTIRISWSDDLILNGVRPPCRASVCRTEQRI